jgi:hypothetical protein
MRLFKYFSQTKLFVNLLLSRNYNNFARIEPIKYYSIKTIKQYYYDNNIYLDLYNDLNNSNLYSYNLYSSKYNSSKFDSSKFDSSKYNSSKFNSSKYYIYTKYNDLTAEHIFPQSFTKQYSKANKDMHNIYLTNYYTNNLRSNKKFSHFINENISKKIYIPSNYSRGIIARALVYMKYTYPLLNLSSIIDYDIIILWNELYPPTDYELQKNNIIFHYQGNKNIFIEDYKKLELFINNNFNL